MKNVLEWANQHKKVAIGAGVGVVALVVAAVVAVLGITGVIPTGNTFAGGDITRGEWIKMFGEKFNMTNYDETEPYYTDVKSDDETFLYVQTLVENEVMSGEGEAKLNEKITLEEAYIQLAKNYGDNYVKGALGKEKLTDKDWVTFLTEKAEVSTERMNKGFSKKAAEELLDKVYNHYLNRTFRNIGEVDYAENVIDLSTVINYAYADGKLTVTTDNEISVGSVLVLGATNEYTNGLGVKVTGVSKENGAYVLQVTEPKLEEIVDSFYLETEQVVDFEGFEPAEGISVVEVGAEGTENAKNNVLVADGDELFSAYDVAIGASFNADKKGKFIKLNANLSKGKVSVSSLWEDLGYELEMAKASGYQYTTNEKGELVSKFDDSGCAITGGLTLKDLILNGSVTYEKGKLAFDLNTGITVLPELSMEGNIKGKQFKVGSKTIQIPHLFGFAAKVDIYLYVDFKGQITAKPEIVGLINVKKTKGKSINATGKCDVDLKAEICAEAKLKTGPDITLTYLNLCDLLDVYAYMGAGAEVTYSINEPSKVKVEAYAPTLEVGVSDNDNTVLSKLGFKMSWKLIDKAGALKKCPFAATYTFDILSRDLNYSQGIEGETQGSTEGSSEVAGSEATGGEAVNGGSTSGDSSGDNSSGDNSTVGGNSTESATSSGNTGGSTENVTQKPTENKPTESETTVAKYRLSTQGYDEASYYANNFYVVKVNGKYGAVDFAGNVRIPTIYESVTGKVGTDEIEFVNGNNSYVYNINTAKQVYSYVNYEVCTTECYEFNVDNATLYGHNKDKYIGKSTSIKRGYKQGVLYAVIRFDEQFVYEEYNGTGESKERVLYENRNKIEFTNVASGNKFYSEYTDSSDCIDDTSGLAISVCDDGVIAYVEGFDFKLEKRIYYKISTNSSQKVEDMTIPQCAVYTDGYIKGLETASFCAVITNVNTAKEVQNYDYTVERFYCGNGEYWGIKPMNLDNGLFEDSYVLLKGNKEIAKGFTWLNFTSDKYIIACKDGKVMFLDYNAKEQMTVKSSSSFYNGKALVYDGVGLYYIDENLNKITDYVYKEKVEAYSMGSVKINGKYYLISQ